MSISRLISKALSCKLNLAEMLVSIPEHADNAVITTIGTLANPVSDAIIVDNETDKTTDE